MPRRVEADAALRVRGHVAEVAGDVAMCGFVQRNGEKYRERVNGQGLGDLA